MAHRCVHGPAVAKPEVSGSSPGLALPVAALGPGLPSTSPPSVRSLIHASCGSHSGWAIWARTTATALRVQYR
eukprot:9466937-Alexandrium_andersonii.AAC.1